MANISGASLTQIQQRLRDTPAYHPFDADTFCDWAMEAGDIVTVRRGEESYQSPIHSSHLVWRGKQNMELNASGTKERDAIARVSKQKYARGGYGMRQQKSLYYEFYSEDGYLHSYIQMSESILVTHFDNSLSDLHSEFSQTAERIQSSVWANESLIYSTVEQTATYIKSEVASAESRMGSSIYQTASGIRSDVWAAESLIYSTIEQTASNIRAEVISAESRMGSSIEMAASGIRSDVWAANSTIYSTIEQTASRIDQTVAQQQNDLTELKGRVIVEAGKASLVAEITDNRRIIYYRTMDDFPDVGDPNIICLDTSTGKYYEWKASAHGYVETEPNKVIKASSITTAINEAGDSETHIDSDHIYIGNQTSTTVISGKMNTRDLTADFIAGKLAVLSTLTVNGITANGSVTLNGTTYLTGTTYITGSDGTSRNLGNGIQTLYKHSESGGTVTLRYIDFNGEITDVSFSRAISSASWEWTNGMPKVTLSPQDQSFTGRQITYGAPYQDSQDSNRWKMEIVEIDTSTTPPRYVTIPGRTIPLWNYLEAKTGTAKITSNGTFTPGTGKIGFSSVEVDVDATVTGAWEQSNPQSSANPYNKYTVRKGSGTVALSEIVNVTQSYDSTTHQYTATVSATNRASVITAVTGTDAYTDGVTAGGNAAGLTIDVTNKKVKRSASSNVKEYVVSAVAGISYNSSTHKYTASATAKVGDTNLATNSVDSGTDAYDAGVTAGGTAAGLTIDTTNHKIKRSTSSNVKEYPITVSCGTPSYDSSTHKYSFSADAKADTTTVNTGSTSSGTEAYDAGKTDGYNSAHVTGSWSNNVFTYSKTNDSTKPNSASVTIGTRFNSASTGYYVSSYRTVGSSTSDIANTATYYKLGTNSAGTVVQVQDRNGNQIGNTPIYNLPTIGISSTTATVNAGKSVTIYATKNGSNVTSAACTVTARSIGYVTIDDKGNHNGDWWNFKCFTQKGGTLVCEGNTDVANYGMYVPGSSASHTITNFNTGSPSGQSYNAIVNGTEGYMLVGSGNDATAYIVTKSTWNCDGNSKTGVSYLQSAPTLLYKKGYADGGGGGGGTHTPSIEGWDRSDWSVDVNGNIPTGYIKIAETSRHNAGYVFKFKISATADCQGVKQSGSKGYYIVLT